MSVRTSSGGQSSLPQFLSSATNAVHQAIDRKEKVTLVIGNQEADQDSIVSAVLFAYFRSAAPPTKAWTQMYIPIAQLTADEVASQQSLSRLLSHSNIQPNELITLDDIVKQGGTSSGLIADNTRIFLVNQNKLEGRMGENYSKNIIGCIDTHDDENYVPRDTDPEPRIIGKAATSTSLVINHARQSYGSGESQMSDPQVARLALGAILLDTENMQSRKVTREDEEAVGYLESIVGNSGDGSAYNRSDYYDSLTGRSSIKNTHADAATSRSMPQDTTMTGTSQDTSMMGGRAADAQTSGGTVVRDQGMTDALSGAGPGTVELPILLDRSFKHFPSSNGNVGISHVSQSIKELIVVSEHDIAHKAIAESGASGAATAAPSSSGVTSGTLIGSPLTAAIREFAQSKGCDLYGLVTDSSVGRELFLWVLHPKLSHAMPRFMDNFYQPLGLKSWEGESDEIVKEAGMSDGMMKVHWLGTKDATPDVIAGMLGQAVGA